MSFAKRFIGAENLPTRLSEFDVQQSFCMSADDIAAVSGVVVLFVQIGALSPEAQHPCGFPRVTVNHAQELIP